tara:strand:+ start:623 stop:1666 length:1044 start_codon:yes stop_codon:yes gene_type:complete
MSIRADGRTFQATVVHKGVRKRRRFGTFEDAEIWAAQAKADLVAGRLPDMGDTPQRAEPGKPKTLGEIVEYTYRNHWSGQKSGADSHRNALKCCDILGAHTPIKSVDLFMIDRLTLGLQAEGLGNGTINRKLAALSKCLTIAKDLGIIDSKPKVTKRTEKVGRIRWFTDDELREMTAYFNHLGHSDFAHWVRFQADTGFRCGETRSLEWQDIQGDFVILPDSKSGSPRGVPMTKAARAAVEAMRLHKQGPFKWATAGHIRNWWDRLRLHMEWANDKEAVPHALRHTFCSRLVQRGVPILTVKELAGHLSLETTLRYAHLAPHNLVDAVNLLEPSGPASLSLANVVWA